MKSFGWLLLLGGIIGAFYFFVIFDTTVDVPSTSFMGESIGGGSVNNLGLMSEQQNGIIISVGAAILGVLMIGKPPKPRLSECPWCKRMILIESNWCNYCGNEVHYVP